MVEASLVNYAELGVLVVGVVIALRQLRDIKETRQTELETRQAQLFMNIYNQSFNNSQFHSAWDRIRNLQWNNFDEYSPLFEFTNSDTRDNRLALNLIGGFYEGVGVLVKENLLDIRMVALLMTGPTKDFWEKIESVVEENRVYYNYPRFFSETEYLYNELMKYIAEHPEIKI